MLGIRPVSEAEQALARYGWEIVAAGVARVRLASHGLDVTVGVIRAGTRLVVVDAGSTAREGAALRRTVEDAYGRPVSDVVVTHAHFDHYGGAAELARHGARVWVHAALSAYVSDHGGAMAADAVTYGVAPEEAREALDTFLALPAEPVGSPRPIAPGVTLLPQGPAHSGHDLAVVTGPPDSAGEAGDRGDGGGARVVFCGDLVESSGPPSAGPDATVPLWPRAVDALLTAGGAGAVYVPGHGPLVDAAFVRAQRDELARGAPD